MKRASALAALRAKREGGTGAGVYKVSGDLLRSHLVNLYAKGTYVE